MDLERIKANPLMLSIWTFASIAIHVLLFKSKLDTGQSLPVRIAMALAAAVITLMIHELIHFIFATALCKSKPTIRISKDRFGFPAPVTFFDSEADRWKKEVIWMMPFLILTVATDVYMFAAEGVPLFLLIIAAANCAGSYFDIFDIFEALIKKPAKE